MSLQSLIDRILHYFSWLYHRRWETWELVLAIGIIIGVFLALGIRTQRRKMNRHKHHAEWPIFH